MEGIEQHIEAARQGKEIGPIHPAQHHHLLPGRGGGAGQTIEVEAGERRNILFHEHEQRIGNRPGDRLQGQIEIRMEFLQAMQAAP